MSEGGRGLGLALCGLVSFPAQVCRFRFQAFSQGRIVKGARGRATASGVPKESSM
jgi:hypothetical protein